MIEGAKNDIAAKEAEVSDSSEEVVDDSGRMSFPLSVYDAEADGQDQRWVHGDQDLPSPNHDLFLSSRFIDESKATTLLPSRQSPRLELLRSVTTLLRELLPQVSHNTSC